MIKIFKRTISQSQSNYKIKSEFKNVTQQCSYNLPIESENFLVTNNLIVKIPSSNNHYYNYQLSQNASIELGNNIIAIIGNNYNSPTNKAIFTHTEDSSGNTPKLQLKKTEFSGQNNQDYQWFVKLYENNYEGVNFVMQVDTGNKTILFDIELTSVSLGLNAPMLSTKAQGGFNKIYYGCPGCGKSYLVNKLLENIPNENKFRVTFHPEYTNSDFVGQVVPTIEKVMENGQLVEKPKYQFVKGPFTLALERALAVNEMVYLVIEEINRGNAAAIFGDLFQLLDRVQDPTQTNYLESEYPVNNVNIQKELNLSGVAIPSNLAIIGTMNTSDQNVFTLDTAFKRRWEFVHIDNNFTSQDTIKDKYVPGTNIKWETFVVNVNKRIASQLMGDSISDDKRIGKYFITPDYLEDNPTQLKDGSGNVNIDIVEKAKRFGYKVLEYIWDDVAKYEAKANWFDTTKIDTLEKLIEEFVNTNTNNPVAVFIDNLF